MRVVANLNSDNSAIIKKVIKNSGEKYEQCSRNFA
jgi:hypothetical protein